MDAISTPPKRFPIGGAAPVVASLALALGGVAWWWSRPTEPSDHWAKVAKAREYLQTGRPDLAVRELAAIDDQSPGATEALTLSGQAFLMGGRLPAARRSLERALKIQPDQADALKMLAAIYLTYSDAPRAIGLLERATRLDPRDFRPWYAIGKAQAGQGKPEEAARAFQEASDRGPPMPEIREIRVGLARALLDAGRVDDVAPVLDGALRDSPNDPELLGLAARRARDLGEVDAAVLLADRALALDPNNLDALLTRARENQRRGHPEAALPDLETATALDPDDLASLQMRLQVESRLGLVDKVTETGHRLKKARERRTLMDQLARQIGRLPNDPEPRWKLGQAAAEAGQATLASQCFQAALDLDSNCRPAREGLAKLSGRP